MSKRTAMFSIALVSAVAVAVLVSALAAAPKGGVPPNPKAGKSEAALCGACHGAEGMSVATNVPNLAGQHYEYLMEQLIAYKEGTRKNGVMNELIRPMSLEQLQNIAAYFSSVPLTVDKGKTP